MNLWIDTHAAAEAETLFGLPPIERLKRSVGSLADGTRIVLSGPDATSHVWPGAQIETTTAPLGSRLRQALAVGPLVALDGANVIDARLIAFLGSGTARACVAARGDGAKRAVAMRLQPELAESIPADARTLCEVADALLATGRISLLDEAEFPSYINKLRRSLPYWLYAVNDADERRRLERQMFWDNYKGSTDLLTRYVYPPLVWPLVRLCVRLNIHPNAVTVLSILLAIAAVPLFAAGDFFIGFVCAYGMSVLDSVDGKLARLTLTSSEIGNVLDHGLDQVHPPFWYFAFALGLGAHSAGDTLYQAALWLIAFYVTDRLILALARRRLGFTLHAATPLDGMVRSFIARRNITMTIMALSLLLGVGPAGLYLITAWQGLTFAWHTSRTIWLGYLVREPVRPMA